MESDWSLKIFSILSISALVLSYPTKAIQSFTTTPDPSNSLPLFKVAAPIGIYNIFANSWYSSIVVPGWTIPPALFNTQ